MAVRQFNADEATELIGRRIRFFDILAQFFVGLVFAPVLRAQDIEDISSAPIGIALGASAGAINRDFSAVF
jgi:hypothetical protein